jgi:hypothetical protein
MTLNVYQSPVEKNFSLEVADGNVPGYSVVHKFGRHDAVGTTFEPISMGGGYQTPQAASATTLRVKAGNANDTAAGSGAREITLVGLDETGAEVTEALATAGTSASSATTATFMRLYRAYVSDSGTYSTSTTGSHTADVTIENGAGGTDWLTIDSTDYPRGQSEVGAYTVPLTKTAYIQSIRISVDSTKTATVMLLKRENILEAAAPYSAMRLQMQFGGVTGEAIVRLDTPMGPFPALTDILFMAKAGTPAEVDVDFEIILIDET